MRLIDADELIENINEIYKGYMTDECGCAPCDFEKIVDERPTAYDVDNVVKELEELKAIKEIDLEIPQHFTKDQSDWIKKYVILKKKEAGYDAIDECLSIIRKGMEELLQSPWANKNYMNYHDDEVKNAFSVIDDLILKKDIEQMKEGGNNDN